MEDIPIEFCEICNGKLVFNIEDQTINVSECSKCHKLACSSCIEHRHDLNKWLCRKCYEIIIKEDMNLNKGKKKLK